MKLYIQPYQLTFKSNKLQRLNPEGSLLAFDFGSGLTGYSDFLPQPHFGESSLSSQLSNLKKGKQSLRFLIAQEAAQIDALARSEKRNLFFGLKIPQSHFLIEDLLSFSKEEELVDSKYQRIKVKLQPFLLTKQADKLKRLSKTLPQIKWRLDLNGASWKIWNNKLDFLLDHLDFIEDPLEKTFISKKQQSWFAQDWIPAPHFQIKIVKPCRESLKSLSKGLASFVWKRVIFTHSFNHPLGQSISAFQAGKFYHNQHHLFETGALKCFSLQEKDFYLHKNQGPVFDPPAGFGFGFDETLKKQNWKRWL